MATAYRKSNLRSKKESQILTTIEKGRLYRNPVMKNCGTYVTGGILHSSFFLNFIIYSIPLFIYLFIILFNSLLVCLLQ